MGDRGAQHVDQHRLIAGRHQDDVGEQAQVGDVEGAVVGRAVVADKSRPVQREGDVELLQADVVDDLVVGALQEGRVDRADRLRPLDRQPRSEQDPVLLGDADVVVLPRGPVGELLQAGPPRHRRRDPDHALVALGLGDHRVGEDVRVLGRGAGGRRLLEPLRRNRVGRVGLLDGDRLGGRGFAVDDRVRLRRVPLLHPLQAALLCRGESLPLDRVDVDDDGAVGVKGLAESIAQRVDVVAVDHAHVGEVELLEEEAGRPVGLDCRLDLRPEPFDPLAEAERQLGQPVLDALAGVVETAVEPHPVEVAREGADVR